MHAEDILKNEKRNKSKLKGVVFGAIAIVFVILIPLQVTTQVFASDVNYYHSLGWQIRDRLYYPWAIIDWYFTYTKQRHLFTNAFEIGQITFILSFLGVVIFFAAVKSKLKGVETLHGSARWATTEDIEQTGLLNDIHDGKPYVYVGGYVDKKGKMHYLTHSGPEHILCYAPTRSGKGVGLVIPTLLEWKASAVITDLKGELWAITAGYRKSGLGNKVIRFEPAVRGSAHWNPLAEIRIGTEHEVGDAQNLANMIVDPDGKGLDGQDGHWKKTAFAFYTGLILHVLYMQKNGDLKEEASFSTIDAMLSDTSRKIEDLYTEMTEYIHDKANNKVHAVVAAAGKDQLDRPEEERGSVLSTVKSYLSLYRDPIVSENTSKGDFRINDIMNFDKPVSVYVVTQPSDKTRLKPLIRIFVNMTVRILASKMKFEKGRAVSCNKHRLLMMLDEFPSLGKLDIMQESLAFVAGYGIKCYLITQDLSQLKNDYGQNESITSNCHIQNAYPPNRMDTAEYLSKMTGQTTIVKKSITKSGKGLSSSSSVTMQEVQRPLLTPDECMRLKGARKTPSGDIKEAGDMLIFVAGYPAIYGRQILYFMDKTFRERSLIKAPDESDLLYVNGKVHIEKKIELNSSDIFDEQKEISVTTQEIEEAVLEIEQTKAEQEIAELAEQVSEDVKQEETPKKDEVQQSS